MMARKRSQRMQQAIAKVRLGYLLTDAAKLYGVDISALRRACRAEGIPPRPRGRHKQENYDAK